MVSKKRLPSATGKRPAQRNLFGPVDRQQLHMEYQAALQKDLEEACRRWGFDFTSDKPLKNSSFHWESVPLTEAPQLYRTCKTGAGLPDGCTGTGSTATTRRGRAEPSQCDKENIPQTSEKCVQNQKREENTTLKRKQTNLTDFYQAKRRVVWMPCKSGE
ncbi:cyclin-dependent kinase inhibitor 1 isoform X2 [Gouania willdenowi]|uniref:Cyclin-dependent kinase inhibitor 1-like n=2 Tax=Gouania willdenowi TaxID=441366 RepID=A0A8C5E9V4_GOUWI|nr:cyclin-dependent kinase inhibitor 1-like isoform X2 [Gouania willdenowi]